MPDYLRPRVSGATIFFTVALAERGSDLLVREVGRLRGAVRATQKARAFGIDAWVVLPDHLHCVWTLPAGETDFSTRWGAIKARFSRSVREVGFQRRAEFTPAVNLAGTRWRGEPRPTHRPGIKSGPDLPAPFYRYRQTSHELIERLAHLVDDLVDMGVLGDELGGDDADVAGELYVAAVPE
jgi:REP element-mobilizing transposase RayT